MTENVNSSGEDLYLNIYGIVAANADYLEPEEGVDLMLAETVIAGLVATIFTELIKGLFGELGKGIAENLKKRLFRKSELVETEPELLIEELDRRLSRGAIDPDKLSSAGVRVEAKLREIGIADEHSTRLANEIIQSIRRHQDGR